MLAAAQNAARAEASRLGRVQADHNRINNHNYFGDFGRNLSQGFQNVAKWGPLALFGGGSLWGR